MPRDAFGDQPHSAQPLRVGATGRFASTTGDEHVRDLIVQLLFTSPGERVNRPDFGCGLRELVFEPGGDVTAATTRFLVQGALNRWLEDVVDVTEVQVTATDGELRVEVAYTRVDDGLPTRDVFLASTGPGTA